MKVYEAVAQALLAESGQMFGLLGDGNMWFWACFVAGGGTIYSARHEAAAVAMADGYSRATGRVGIVTVTNGPGVTQIGTSLTVAARHRSALVLITGDVPKGAKNQLQAMDQKAFVEACGARFLQVSSPDNLAEEMAEAFYAAQVHRRPVVLNLPLDLQNAEFDWDFEYRPSAEFIQTQKAIPDPAAIALLVDALVEAERPIIIAGRGAMRAGAREEIIALAERAGALLGTSLQAKGFFAGAAYDIGIAGSFATAPAEQLLAEADFVLGVGAELGYYTSEGGLLFPQARVARIDIKPSPDEIGILPGLYVHGDARLAAEALNAGLAQRQVKRNGFRTAETDRILAAPTAPSEVPTDGLDPRAVARELSRALPQGSLFTCGAGHFQCFPVMYTALPEGGEIQFSYHFGAVGQGLPMAIGLGLGNPGRAHVAVEGDGSLLMNIQELETVVRYGLQLVLIVWNDAGYGAETLKLRSRGYDPGLAQWKSPDFVSIARAFGGEGMLLEREADLSDAVRKGLKAGGLFVIDVRVSPTTLADPYNKLYYGLPNRAPLIRAARG